MERAWNNITRMRVHACMVLVLLIMALQLGCHSSNPTPIKISYDFIYTAETTYNAAHDAVVMMDSQGRLTEDQKATILAVADKYYTSVQVAKAALVAYKTAEDSKDEVSITKTEVVLRAAVKAMQSLEEELVRLLLVASNGR